MDLSPANVTCGLLFLIFVLLFVCYRNAMKKVGELPFRHIVPKLVYHQITGIKPKDVPLTSYALHYLLDVCRQHQKDGIFMFYITQPALLVFGEKAFKFFCNETLASDKSSEYSQIQDVLGPGILTSGGERWKKHRKMINPAFHIGMLKEKIPLFNEHALCLMKDMKMLAGKPCVDPLDILKCNYFNALSESIFGLKQGAENRAENLKYFSAIDALADMIVTRMMYPWLRLKFLSPFSAFGRKYLKMKKFQDDFITKVIYDMEKHVASSNYSDNSIPEDSDMNTSRFSKHLRKSFAYILLKQHFNDPTFTFEDLKAEANTILSTGYDTTTYTTLWCMFMLGLHPDVQERAYEEVQSVTPEGYVTYEDICNLPYLEAVMMETLRLYPTVPVFGRKLPKDVQYEKYKVYKGTSVTFINYLLHRIPEIYPNPENFDPERFLIDDPRRTGNYTPFAEGSRMCIGKKYAMIEIKIFLAHMLRNFKITSLDKREDIKMCWTIALIPTRPLHMKITSRLSDDNIDKNALLNQDTQNEVKIT